MVTEKTHARRRPRGRRPRLVEALRGALTLLDWQEQIVRAALDELEGRAGPAATASGDPPARPPPRQPSARGRR